LKNAPLMVRRFPVVVTDVDGTLLNSKRELSPFTAKTLGRYLSWGGRIILATGKLYPSIEGVCRQLRLKDRQIIGNGTVLVDPVGGGKQVISHLDALSVKRIEAVLNEMGIPFVYYRAEAILYRKGLLGPEYLKILHQFGEDYVRPTKSDFSQDIPDVIKILSFVSEMETERRLRRIVSGTCPGIRVIRTTSYYLEYMNTGISKAQGLEKILEKLGIGMQSVIAFGDEENDIEILKLAGIGVAVGNASPQTKKAADYVVESNDEDGVARFLRNFLSPSSQDGVSPRETQ